MKTKQIFWLVIWVSCCAGVAYAETVSGTVTSIDSSGQNVTLRRADTNDTVTVHVTDVASLNTLSTGGQVSVDTSRNGDVWEAKSFNALPDSSARPMAGAGADGSAAGGSSADNQALKSNNLESNSLTDTDHPAAANGSADTAYGSAGAATDKSVKQ